MIRPATPDDAPRLAEIYNHYVENTTVTFEETAISATQMRQRMTRDGDRTPWLVAEWESSLVAYAYATSWSRRSGYRTSVETTVYVADGYLQKGYGAKLYRILLDELRRLELHCAIGVIALPNPGSVALHERLGFRKIGEFEEIGTKFGRWVNVGYWQLLL